MTRFSSWFDQRTGYQKLVADALFENIPGGSRWRYIWGSTLVFTLAVQFITGVFLWMHYSPSAQTAWESVYFIQNGMTGGWLLRGIHHHAASVMNVLLVLHLMQVLIDGAYRAPREVNFWFGLLLLGLVLALSLTGYLLPWDQKGFWATTVSTNIAAIAPVIGPALQRLIVGGAEYGHHTLTRFFALHAGILPALIVILVAGHVALFRRHGITPATPKRRPDAYFWPDQVLKDAVACLAVMAAVLFLVIRPWLFGTGEALGAELGAPADPTEPYSAARPEWYFLFLFQFLKYFPSGTEVWGAMVIPGIIVGVVFLMPFIGQWRQGHRFNIGFCSALLAGMALLSYLAYHQDHLDPSFQAAQKAAAQDAERVAILAQAPTGIPFEGAVSLLRNDPFTQGPRLFAKNCASCHRYDGHDGQGALVKDEQRASDLKSFGSRQWMESILDPARVQTPAVFGASKMKTGRMARYVTNSIAKFDDDQKAALKKVIAAVSAQGGLPSQRAIEEKEATLIEEGKKILLDEKFRCLECHQFEGQNGNPEGPDLTGYGSRTWLLEFLYDPGHEKFYGETNDGMPAFGKKQILDAKSIELLADWLRGDWYEPSAATVASEVRKDEPASP